MTVISVRDLVVDFGAVRVLDHVTLDVFEGEILGFVGGSGVVPMREYLGLSPRLMEKIESRSQTRNGRP